MNSCEYECYPFSFLLLKEQEKEADPVERDVQEEGEVIEIEEDMETPPGDWWQRVYSYDEAVEKIDTLPRQYRGGLKSVGRKGGKGGKKGVKGSKINNKLPKVNLKLNYSKINNYHYPKFKIKFKLKKLQKFYLNYKISSFSHFQSSCPGLLQGEEEEEEDLPDPSLMSPAAKILKLGAENTVSNITSYLLHYLGRELDDVVFIHITYIYSYCEKLT